MRYKQVKNLATLGAVRDHLAGLGIDLPVVDELDPNGLLATPVALGNGLSSPNRLAVLPMEGWDGTSDGRPSDLVRRRWSRFAASGCGLVWGEATAVRSDGRANPNQLLIDDSNVESIAGLRALLDPAQVAGLQLTHSGRYAQPVPRTAYEHPLLDARVGTDGASVLTDDELDELAECYVDAARRARDAGFDFVDVKHCHGYLLHELLSAFDRPGRYGGEFAGRTHFLRSVVQGIRARVPDLAIAVRLSVFDFCPYGDHGPDAPGPYAYAFGGDGTGQGIDLTEPQRFLSLLEELGVALVSTTAGSPYYVPHIQRPAYFPPSDGYAPPEDPLVGVARQISATAELARQHPRLTIVGSGYSYLQQWLPFVAQAVVESGGASMIGFGRIALAYPHLAADVFAGRSLDTRYICRTFSDCTTAPRVGLVSGCYPLDPFYKQHPHRAKLAQAKKRARDKA
jgi:2,4-dienoyl-CoA reductase-like NADH-dependent reductase (Old Yellow Enzyme family)